jgi:hypothetical protein
VFILNNVAMLRLLLIFANQTRTRPFPMSEEQAYINFDRMAVEYDLDQERQFEQTSSPSSEISADGEGIGFI